MKASALMTENSNKYQKSLADIKEKHLLEYRELVYKTLKALFAKHETIKEIVWSTSVYSSNTVKLSKAENEKGRFLEYTDAETGQLSYQILLTELARESQYKEMYDDILAIIDNVDYELLSDNDAVRYEIQRTSTGIAVISPEELRI